MLLKTLPVALLLVAALPVLDGMADVRADDTHTDHELLLAAVNEVQVLTDPSGDAAVLGASEASGAAAPTDVDAPVDILALHVAETAMAVRFSLHNRAFPDSADRLYGSDPTYYLWCDIRFEAFEDGNEYSAIITRDYGQTGSTWDVTARFWSWEAAIPEGPALEATLVGRDHFEVIVPKVLLASTLGDRSLRIGDVLSAFAVTCAHGTLSQGTSDRAGPAGAYPISIAPATRDLAIDLVPMVGGVVSVLPGPPNSATLFLNNTAGRPLEGSLEAVFVDALGNVDQDWRVHAPSAFRLGSNRTAQIPIFIQPPPSAAHGTTAILRLTAVDGDQSEKATVERPVILVLGPSATFNEFDFHLAGDTEQTCIPRCDSAVPPLLAEREHLFVLKPRASLPAGGEAVPPLRSIIESTSASATLDAPLALPVALVEDASIELGIALKSEVARMVELRVEITWGGINYVGHAEVEVALTDSWTTHAVSVPHLMNEPVPRGETIELRMSTAEIPPAAPQLLAAIPPAAVEWNADGSWLNLPIAHTTQPSIEITDGRFLPSLSLHGTLDSPLYVNAGKAVAVDLFLINVGSEDDTIQILVNGPGAGWSSSLHPGDRFELRSGQSARVCVEFSAPATAAEGSAVTYGLRAQSDGDPRAGTGILLDLVTTNGVDVPGSSCAHRLDPTHEDYVAPLDDVRQTPAAGPTIAGIAIFACALLLRRRRAGA